MIEIQNISFSYPDADILDNVGFTAEKGQVVGLLGNNGAGKSTLVTCINGIRKSRSGQVLIDGRNAFRMSRNELARTVAYVAQKNELTHTTVFDSVLLGRKPYIKWSVSQEDLDICARVMERVGILDDLAYARLLSEELIRYKAASNRKILSVLYERGVSSSVLQCIKEELPTDESERVLRHLQKKAARLSGEVDEKTKAALFRQGFSASSVRCGIGLFLEAEKEDAF